jgi:predicted RNA binding protein YcfA (HicA-like mRNA interferase family)
MKPIPVKLWIEFLKSKGLKHIRTEASHEVWDNPDKPLLRPCTVVPKHDSVPRLHIHTSLLNLGISQKQFDEEIKLLQSKKAVKSKRKN